MWCKGIEIVIIYVNNFEKKRGKKFLWKKSLFSNRVIYMFSTLRLNKNPLSTASEKDFLGYQQFPQSITTTNYSYLNLYSNYILSG